MIGRSLSLTTAALAFGLFAAPVSAAPTGFVGGNVSSDSSIAERVAQRCYRHRGHLHCERRARVYRYAPDVNIRIGRGHRHGHHRHRHYRD